MHLARGKRTLTEDASPAFSAGRKLSEIEQALLWTLLQEDPRVPEPSAPRQDCPKAETDEGNLHVRIYGEGAG